MVGVGGGVGNDGCGGEGGGGVSDGYGVRVGSVSGSDGCGDGFGSGGNDGCVGGGGGGGGGSDGCSGETPQMVGSRAGIAGPQTYTIVTPTVYVQCHLSICHFNTPFENTLCKAI